MCEQEFEPVHGFEELYEINTDGVVRRILNKFIPKLQLNHNGYSYVHLYYKNKQYLKRVSRLVALTFLGIPKNITYQVNHINGIKIDNRLENLEWVTPSENIRHAIDILGITIVCGEKHGRSKLTEKDVLEIKELFGLDYNNAEIGRKYNVGREIIRCIRNKKRWCHI